MIYNKYLNPMSWSMSFATTEHHSKCFPGELRINNKILHKILVLITLASSDGSDQPAHTHVSSEPSFLTAQSMDVDKSSDQN